MTTLSQSASNIVLDILLMVVWLFVGRGIGRSTSRARELVLTEECERLKQSCDNLTIGKHTFEKEASDLRKSNSQFLSERDKARDANALLRQGWDKTLSEVKPILKDNYGLQQEVTQLKNIVARNDQVKVLSEARIRELETKLSDSQIACKRASVSVTKASAHIRDLQDGRDLEVNRNHALVRENRQLTETITAIQCRVDELENALQTIKGCVEDQMSENFVEMPS